MKRNSAIDYLKLLFSFAIFFYHYGLKFYGGYIVVEGFFIISGYLMYRSVQKKGEACDKPESTASFVWNKYKALFLPLLFSAISGMLIYDLVVYPQSFADVIIDVPLLLFEVFPLQSAGFEGKWTTGVSWYVSAMLIAIAILHPIVKKYKDRAVYTVCPTLSLLVYGFLFATYKTIAVSNAWALGFLHGGVLRAIAGISAGLFLGALLQRSKEWNPSTKTKILLSILELIGLVGLFTVMNIESLAYGPYDLVLVFLQFGILWIALSGKAWHTNYISCKHTGILSNISLYLFLNHVAWCAYFNVYYPESAGTISLLPKAILFVAVSCVVVYGLTTLTRFVYKRVKQKNKPTALD